MLFHWVVNGVKTRRVKAAALIVVCVCVNRLWAPCSQGAAATSSSAKEGSRPCFTCVTSRSGNRPYSRAHSLFISGPIVHSHRHNDAPITSSGFNAVHHPTKKHVFPPLSVICLKLSGDNVYVCASRRHLMVYSQHHHHHVYMVYWYTKHPGPIVYSHHHNDAP